MEPKTDVALILRRGPAVLHLGSHFIGQFLVPFAVGHSSGGGRWIAKIGASKLANGLPQRLANHDRRGAGKQVAPVHLPPNDELVVVGTVPSQGGSVAAEVDGIKGFVRTLLAQEPDLGWSPAVRRLGDRNRRRHRNGIANDLVVPAILG